MKRESVLEKPANPRLAVTRKSSPPGEAVSSPKPRDVNAGAKSAASDFPEREYFKWVSSVRYRPLSWNEVEKAARWGWEKRGKIIEKLLIRLIRIEDKLGEVQRLASALGNNKEMIKLAAYEKDKNQMIGIDAGWKEGFKAGKQVECERAWNVVSDDARSEFAREALKRFKKLDPWQLRIMEAGLPLRGEGLKQRHIISEYGKRYEELYKWLESEHGLRSEEYEEWLKRLNVLGKTFEEGKQAGVKQAQEANLHEFTLGNWGERCKDYDSECPTCQAWKAIDYVQSEGEWSLRDEYRAEFAREVVIDLNGLLKDVEQGQSPERALYKLKAWLEKEAGK